MAIDAELIKQLRQKTNAGFMACKKALEETAGDVQAAEEYLRKKGLMDAGKKSARTTAEGLISCIVTEDLRKAAIVEVNSETDFVSKNDKFQSFVKDITNLALNHDFEQLKSTPFGNGHSVEEELAYMISVIGENLRLSRSQRLSLDHGVIGTYTHNAVTPGARMGKIGVLVCLKSSDDNFDRGEAVAFAKKLSMHVAASSPKYLNVEGIPVGDVKKEKEIATEQAVSAGKPANIAEKIAEGRLKKFYEEVVFLEQTYFEDGKQKVNEVLAAYNREHGTSFEISGFVRYQLGA